MMTSSPDPRKMHESVALLFTQMIDNPQSIVSGSSSPLSISKGQRYSSSPGTDSSTHSRNSFQLSMVSQYETIGYVTSLHSSYPLVLVNNAVSKTKASWYRPEQWIFIPISRSYCGRLKSEKGRSLAIVSVISDTTWTYMVLLVIFKEMTNMKLEEQNAESLCLLPGLTKSDLDKSTGRRVWYCSKKRERTRLLFYPSFHSFRFTK